jgi:hypothetical protein
VIPKVRIRQEWAFHLGSKIVIALIADNTWRQRMFRVAQGLGDDVFDRARFPAIDFTENASHRSSLLIAPVLDY